MTNFQKAQLTLYGLQRIAKAHAGEKMIFTAMGLGDVALTGNLNEVTELTGEKQRFPIAGNKVSGNNFWASCKPVDILDPVGIYVRAIGLYIADPAHENNRGYDKLYAVASIIPDFGEGADYIAYIPQKPENAEINYDFRLNTTISSTALVEIIGGIGSLGIAKENELGLTMSTSKPFGIKVDPATGEMFVNNMEEFAEQLNNLENVVTLTQKIETLENELKVCDERDYPLGKIYIQGPGDPEPKEGEYPLPGYWEPWNHRADEYELAPVASYPSGNIPIYAAGQNVAANAYRIYQWQGDNRQIWQSNKAISSTPTQMNPLDWNLISGITRVRRRDLQDDWTADDLEIGDTVPWNDQEMRIVGILTPGGKYRGAAGGNRGTFGDGTQLDRIRNFTGGFSSAYFGVTSVDGAFQYSTSVGTIVIGTGSGWYNGARINPSHVVPTGNENQVRTSIVNYWRLVFKD
jgi:hypothetical protein